MDDENILDFNFWPSFADLMLSLVLVMVVSMFAFIFYLSLNNIENNVSLKQIESNQETFVREVATAFNSKCVTLSGRTFGIPYSKPDTYDIRIVNDAKVQRITFSTLILFDRDDYALNPKGKEIVEKFGQTLKANLSLIQEIQIQGHADLNKTVKFNSNIELAALRSIQVFHLLKNDVGIDPAKYLMSITSFGEYKPVNRLDSSDFNADKLKSENDTQEKRDINRRIEILLFFK